MNEAMFLLPQAQCVFSGSRHPHGCHHWAQEELAWGFRDAPGDMTVPSAMGAMMEGTVRAVGIDIVQDMWGALEQATARLDAAERFGRFMFAVRSIGPASTSVLDKVYGDPVAETDLMAFGGAANLFPESEVAHDFHKRARTSLGFIQWAGELRVKVAGQRYEDPRIRGNYLRRPPRASETEKAIAEEIRRDTEKKLLTELAAYAMARPRR